MANLRPDKVKPTVDPVAGSAFFAFTIAQPEKPNRDCHLEWSAGRLCLVRHRHVARNAHDAGSLLYVIVNNLSVAATGQRQGVGSALMGYVEQEAARLGIDEVDVSHWAVNTEAKLFYASLGFSAFMELLSKKL